MPPLPLTRAALALWTRWRTATPGARASIARQLSAAEAGALMRLGENLAALGDPEGWFDVKNQRVHPNVPPRLLAGLTVPDRRAYPDLLRGCRVMAACARLNSVALESFLDRGLRAVLEPAWRSEMEKQSNAARVREEAARLESAGELDLAHGVSSVLVREIAARLEIPVGTVSGTLYLPATARFLQERRMARNGKAEGPTTDASIASADPARVAGEAFLAEIRAAEEEPTPECPPTADDPTAGHAAERTERTREQAAVMIADIVADRDELACVREELQQARDQLAALAGADARAMADAAEVLRLRAQVAELEAEGDRLRQELAAAALRLQDEARTAEALRTEREQAEAKAAAQRDFTRLVQECCEEQRARAERAEAETREVTREVLGAQEQIETLEARCAGLAGELEVARGLLARSEPELAGTLASQDLRRLLNIAEWWLESVARPAGLVREVVK